jgi:hypothetical protein
MATIAEIRQQYPQYNDMSDRQLADSLHSKHYADIPKEQFYQKVGVSFGEASGPAAAFAQNLNPIPFNRKLTSAIGAGVAKATGAVTGEDFGSFGDLYNQAEANALATDEANPGASLAGTATGILATLPLGLTNAGQKISAAVGSNTFNGTGKLASLGNLAGRSIKGAAVAAPSAALYGAGEAETGQEIQGAKRGAKLGAAIGAAAPVAGAVLGATGKGLKNAYTGATARGIDELDEAAKAIKDVSGAGYKKMRDIGAVLKPQSRAKVLSTIEQDLLADGPLNQGLHGSTVSLLDDLTKAAKKPGFSLEQLDQYRRLFSRIPRANAEDVRKASIVIESLDDVVNGLGDDAFSVGGREAVSALNSARSEYNRFSKFDRITEILKQSGGDANKIKSNLQRFADNPRKTRGFSVDEINMIQEAAKNTTGEGLLKMAGKFGIDLGSSLSVGNVGLPAIYAALTGAASSAGTGAGVIVGGTAARQTQKWIARGKVEKILKAIESGSKVSAKQVMQLPPSDAKKLMQMMPQIMATKSPVLVERGK